MPILLYFTYIFAAEIVPKQQLIYYFMEDFDLSKCLSQNEFINFCHLAKILNLSLNELLTDSVRLYLRAFKMCNDRILDAVDSYKFDNN